MDEQRPDTPNPGEGAHQPGTDPQPDADDLRRLGEEGGPVGLRVGRDPANLGDEVPEESDLTLPEAMPEPAEM
jgi:hypothetical protein